MELPEAKARNSKLNISWKDFLQDTKALAAQLKLLDPFIAIIAVSRGGLIPASIIAYELGIRYIDTYCVSSYDQDAKKAFIFGLKEPMNGATWNDKRILVVDDLVDTGDTFEFIRTDFPKCHYAAVYAKPLGIPQVDSYVFTVPQDTWINFPWD